MADLIPFTGLVAGNLNTTYAANSVVLTGVNGAVTVNSNIYIDGSGNVGIGTSTISTTNKMAIYGGNVKIGTVGASLVFPDGTYMNTAASGTATSFSTFNYTGDGTTTAYGTGTIAASNVNNTAVYVDGIYQRKSTYTWVGTTLTFSSAPRLYTYVEINVISSLTTPLSFSNLAVTGSGMFAGNIGVGTSSAAGMSSGNAITVWGNVNIVSPNGTYLINGAPSVSGGTIVNDTASSASTFYPTLANNATSGAYTNVVVSSSKLYYTPSTGSLTASTIVAQNGIFVNSNTVTSSYSISSGTNGLSAGPVTIANGVTVTIASGQRWVIL